MLFWVLETNKKKEGWSRWIGLMPNLPSDAMLIWFHYLPALITWTRLPADLHFSPSAILLFLLHSKPRSFLVVCFHSPRGFTAFCSSIFLECVPSQYSLPRHSEGSARAGFHVYRVQYIDLLLSHFYSIFRSYLQCNLLL